MLSLLRKRKSKAVRSCSKFHSQKQLEFIQGPDSSEPMGAGYFPFPLLTVKDRMPGYHFQKTSMPEKPADRDFFSSFLNC